jgi:hypothetical protein
LAKFSTSGWPPTFYYFLHTRLVTIVPERAGRWWIDHGAKESPKAIDELFHRMMWNGLR